VNSSVHASDGGSDNKPIQGQGLTEVAISGLNPGDTLEAGWTAVIHDLVTGSAAANAQGSASLQISLDYTEWQFHMPPGWVVSSCGA
jgi:hypothetical protein